MEEHIAQLTKLDEGWEMNFDTVEDQGLCALPAMAADVSVARLWMPGTAQTRSDTAGDGNRPQGVTSSEDADAAWDAARAEGEAYRRRFEAHVQMVFSRVQHHWHKLVDGKRVPLRYCREKEKKKKLFCRAGFP